jgi:sulfur-carrier protein adenylyltransferase/sulfurtransferase
VIRHYLHPDLLERVVSVRLIGVGGNGSQMLTGLARLHLALRALGHPGLHVTAVDADTVSEANVGRQLFLPSEVGANKAIALTTRVNAAFGLAWDAEARRFAYADKRCDLLVSCVDSARTRDFMGVVLQAKGWKPLYWLDLGNRAADGQVVLGMPIASRAHARYVARLPTVTDLYPELGAMPDDDTPSCSLAQALERQELFVNQAVVTVALQLLWQLWRRGHTAWHGAYVNALQARVQPLPVCPRTWARMGHDVRARTREARQKQAEQAAPAWGVTTSEAMEVMGE